MAEHFSQIILPTRPQPDTVIAVFILQTYGKTNFPGIEHARITFAPLFPKEETPESLEKKGIIAIDIGTGPFDHHASKTKTTASMLIAEALGVSEAPALAKLLEYAERDDFYGKGTISTDALDRAFGLSGLVVNLNKRFPNDPGKVFALVTPLIDAHHAEEVRRTEELPKEVTEQTKAGKVEDFTVRQKDKNLKVVIIESDNISLPGYLRSQLGGRFDIVAQKLTSGHINILSRPTKRPDLRKLARTIRIAEARILNKTVPSDEKYLERPGRIEEIPEWYYDPATNSLQNGGANPQDIPKTHIAHHELKTILVEGLSSA